MKLSVVSIQRCSTKDGPGLRTTVFLKGCPLRCRWCHNPETQAAEQQILYHDSLCIACHVCEQICPLKGEARPHVFDDRNRHFFYSGSCQACGLCAAHCVTEALRPAAKAYTVDALIHEILKDSAFYGERGGLTISGGEPLFHPAACIALLKAAKAAGLHTVVDTCGYFDGSYAEELALYTDLLLWDYKDSDPERHLHNTGVSPEPIWENLLKMDSLRVPVVLRCILVNQVNCETGHYQKISEMYRCLKHCAYVELMGYHAFGGGKSVLIGRADSGKREWIPSKEQMHAAAAYLRQAGVPVAVHV